MTSWVALLRGVNVNGITIRSVDLAALFRELGLSRVATVLASGNVLFDGDGDGDGTDAARSALTARIEAALRERFGYEAWILLFTREELRAAADAFPFDADDDTRQPHLVFCVDESTRDELAEAAASFDREADPVASGPRVVYWNPPRGRSTDTPFAKLAARARYRERTTTRNLRTVRRILG